MHPRRRAALQEAARRRAASGARPSGGGSEQDAYIYCCETRPQKYRVSPDAIYYCKSRSQEYKASPDARPYPGLPPQVRSICLRTPVLLQRLRCPILMSMP